MHYLSRHFFSFSILPAVFVLLFLAPHNVFAQSGSAPEPNWSSGLHMIRLEFHNGMILMEDIDEARAEASLRAFQQAFRNCLTSDGYPGSRVKTNCFVDPTTHGNFANFTCVSRLDCR